MASRAASRPGTRGCAGGGGRTCGGARLGLKSEPGGHGTVAATCQCCRCAVKGCWGSRGRVWAGRKRGGWQAPGRAGAGEYALGGGEYGCCTPQMGWRLGGAGT
jgi:hypothetical protein